MQHMLEHRNCMLDKLAHKRGRRIGRLQHIPGLGRHIEHYNHMKESGMYIHIRRHQIHVHDAIVKAYYPSNTVEYSIFCNLHIFVGA